QHLSQRLPKITPKTITDRRTLSAQLDLVRKRGWASVPDEGMIGFNRLLKNSTRLAGWHVIPLDLKPRGDLPCGDGMLGRRGYFHMYDWRSAFRPTIHCGPSRRWRMRLLER